jgi:hypothetical protein
MKNVLVTLSSSNLSGDLTSLSFALLSILLYFLPSSSLLVLDLLYFSIPRFYIWHHISFEIFFFQSLRKVVHLSFVTLYVITLFNYQIILYEHLFQAFAKCKLNIDLSVLVMFQFSVQLP